MSFPRYPAYKDSGVEWLGSVPEHWRVDRLKASITSCRNGIWGDEAQDDENDIPCVRVADFDRQKLHVRLQQPTIRNVTEKERAHRLLKRGDLLLEKSGGGENQPVGCVVLYDDDQPAVCSNFVAKVEMASSMDSSYWRYVHAAAYAVRLTIGSINQTSGIQNLDQDRYFNERAAFPPQQEQTAIGKFLDRETAKIDALVAEQEQLITLLKEKRQAVISHAVTKGLDPSVPMKDSGVEWLGEVPAHWQVKQLRHVARIVRGASPRPAGDPKFFSRDESDETNVPWVTVAEITKDDSLYLTDVIEFLTPLGADASQRFERDTVIFSNSGATLGVPKILAIDCCANDGVLAFKNLDQQVHREFLYFFLSTTTERLRTEMKQGGGQPNLNTDIVKNIGFAVPSLDEQVAIVRAVQQQTARFNDLICEAQRGVGFLQERRSALISAAVTGQIDVRQFAQ